MDASYKIQRGIHVHLIQFFMCPEFWVHITWAYAKNLVFIYDIFQSFSTRKIILYKDYERML